MLVKATDSSRGMITANATSGTPTDRETYTTSGTNISTHEVGIEGISGTKIRGGTATTEMCDQTTEIMVRIDNETTTNAGTKSSSDLFWSQIITL